MHSYKHDSCLILTFYFLLLPHPTPPRTPTHHTRCVSMRGSYHMEPSRKFVRDKDNFPFVWTWFQIHTPFSSVGKQLQRNKYHEIIFTVAVEAYTRIQDVYICALCTAISHIVTNIDDFISYQQRNKFLIENWPKRICMNKYCTAKSNYITYFPLGINRLTSILQLSLTNTRLWQNQW
jgi:hypothetical protein